MMYLVRPNQLLWADFAGIKLQRLVEIGGNLEAIEWAPSERPVWDSDMAIALRYGVPVSTGIVVEAIHILDKEKPGELRRLYEQTKKSQEHPSIAATDEFIDRYMIPGWRQSGVELNARLDDAMENSIREAEEEAAALLEESVKPELVAHWRSIGGFIPS